MSTFALDVNSNAGDIIGGLNYALANLGTISSAAAGNVLVANIATGEITTTSSNSGGYTNTTIVSYLYQYMDVKYANSSTGGSGFTSSPTLANYYGLRNTSNVTISSNPVDYVWFQVSGGFGLTKQLYYQTIGGRQVAFFAGSASPDPSFIVVPDMPNANSTPLNLDTITSAQNNQIVNVNAYYQANIVPATPSGGTYNFQTFTLTAPAGWTANIPSSGNTTVYISQAAFVGNTNQTAAPPATPWTVPVVYNSQFQGNTGPTGQRGFVPMGFVITSTDPTTYSNVQLTTAYSSSRTNPSPPVGLGFAPIQYDTAQFAYTNLFTGNTVTLVKQYDGSGWTSVVGDVISGGLFVPGSISANTLNANQVYALTITGGNVTPGINSGYGYWLTANAGNAYFGGNVNIGNNLYVGNLITAGTLNANTVNSAQINYGAITQNQIANSAVTGEKILNQAIEASKLVLNTITNAQIANSTITGTLIAQNTITGNLVATNTIFANSIIANSFVANTINGSTIIAGTITADQLAANVLTVGNIVSTNATFNDNNSIGYWLNNVTGNVRLGGNVSIGANLSVQGLITQGLLANSVVATNNLAPNATNQSVVGTGPVGIGIATFTNGNTTVPTNPGYLWPFNTRALAVQNGVTIIPTSNGAVGGSRLTINYNTFISVPSPDDGTYNLVELWKSGQDNAYASTITKIVNMPPSSSASSPWTSGPLTTDYYALVGANIAANLITTTSSNVYYNLNSNTYSSVTGTVDYNAGSPVTLPIPLRYWRAFNYNCAVRNTGISYTGNVANYTAVSSPSISNNGRAGTFFNISGTGAPLWPGIVVGLNGTILRDAQGGVAYDPSTGALIEGTQDSGLFESSGTSNDLFDVAVDNCESRFDGNLFTRYVAVGAGGTILYNSRNYNSSTGTVSSTTNWALVSAPTTNNLNSVWSNWSLKYFSNIGSYANDRGNTWVAVGDKGTICYSSNGTTWTAANIVPTVNNLQSVTYVNGYWVAVGDNGTVITANNITKPYQWYGPITNAAATATPPRTLYSVAGGLSVKNFVAAGEGIVIRSAVNPNGAWTTQTSSSIVYTTASTRLQYFGSFANVLSTDQPPEFQRIANNQVISSTYTDYNYTAGTPVTYYLVVGNLKSNANIYTQSASLTLTEYKK